MRVPRETKDLKEHKDQLDLKVKPVPKVKLESLATLVPRVPKEQLETTEKKVSA